VTTPIERCTLAPGLSVSRVIAGLWQIADMERDGATIDLHAAAEAMIVYVEAGVTTFDMADHYGSAEEIVGHFNKQLGGHDAQFLTKWVPQPGTMTRETVRAAVQRSLDRMQMDRLDLLQFHAWNYADPRWLDALFWLQELQSDGLICQLGLTNFDTAHLRVALQSGIPIVSNQVCFSLLDRRPAHGMTSLCSQHGVKLLAFGTVAGGFLTDRWLGKPAPDVGGLRTWSQMKYRRFIDAAGGWSAFQRLLDVVAGAGRALGVSAANVSCRYILDQPAVAGIIVGARLGESDHIQENLRLFEFAFDDDARSAIAETESMLDPIPGDSGDEYRRPPFLTASGDLSHHIDSIPPPYEAHTLTNGRVVALSGTMWERIAGFGRAVRQGNRIWVSGTTATHGDRVIGGSDPVAQFHFAVDKIEGSIMSLGGELRDVVRTRVFIRNLDDWEPIARAHGERFREILPANTLVQADLVGDAYLVEVEAEAVVREDPE